MATEGPRAVMDGSFHLEVAGEHLADGREGSIRQATGLG